VTLCSPVNVFSFFGEHTVSIFRCQRVRQRQKRWHGDVQRQRLSYSDPVSLSRICPISFTLDLPFDTKIKARFHLQESNSLYDVASRQQRTSVSLLSEPQIAQDIAAFMKLKGSSSYSQKLWTQLNPAHDLFAK
jgi:hypothetical protein